MLGALLALLAPAQAHARPASSHATRGATREVDPRALLRSHELWATINVCNPADRPNTVGIRGSMPGDSRARDRMYMAFRLQYQNATTKAWADLAKAVSPTWIAVGAGASARQGGFSFTLKPTAGKPAVELRGVVDFQWRRGRTVRLSAARVTTARHKSVTGADPRDYSAETCAIG
jgi:hypothetical protein